jgi:type II secretory pathway predicted ATPase ExeA
MFQVFFGMHFNPFIKDLDVKYRFETNDFTQAESRLTYLLNIKGIALLVGEPGCGKSFVLRSFVTGLNRNLFKTVYIPISTLTVLDFYRALASGLGQFPKNRKIDLFTQFQESIISYAEKNITPLIIIDEAQYISNSILNDLRIILNFEMDSKDHAILILSGQSPLVTQLNRQPHEALRQRIVLNYAFKGLAKDETKNYITNQLKRAGVAERISSEDALELIHSNSNGILRKINSLVNMALLSASRESLRTIDAEFIFKVINETEISY